VERDGHWRGAGAPQAEHRPARAADPEEGGAKFGFVQPEFETDDVAVERDREDRGTALVALPLPKGAEKITLDIHRERLPRQMAKHVDRPSHLVEVGLARRTGHDVFVEASAIGRRQRPVEIVGHENDELSAR
jgi:hypothetical protein